MPAAAIIGALGGIAQGLANSSIGNKMSLRSQKDLYNYTLPKEQEAQYNMIKNSPRLMVEGMQAAGLNPASITSGYQGAAGSGDAGARTQPLAIDAVNSAMAAQQMELNSMSTKAAVQKTEQETENLRLQNEWYERVQGANIAVQEASAALMKNQSKEIQELLPKKIDEFTKNINLLDSKITYQQALNDTMETEYDFGGKKVKGKDIPNFKELVTLQLAQETLKVDWFKAITERQGIERDPLAVLTKEWFAPMIKALSGDVESLTPEVRSIFQNTVSQVRSTLETLEKMTSSTIGVAGTVNKVLQDPSGTLGSYLKGKIKVATKPFDDWYKKFKSNTNKGKYF